MTRRQLAIGVSVCGVALAFVGAVRADRPADGLYRLSNHPDGNQNPPPYGLRLDGLDGQVSNPRHRYTFDFNFDDGSRQAAMFMDLDFAGNSIRIFGTVYGGLNDPANQAVYDDPGNGRVGWWNVDFTYTDGIGAAPGDGGGVMDVVAGPDLSADHSSDRGTLTADPTVGAPLDGFSSSSFDLVDYLGGHSASFRFGDEDNGLGHRGFDGLSGWGWVNHSGYGTGPDFSHVAASDWLFTAEPVPAPGAFVLGALGLSFVGWVRRRSSQA